MEKPIRKNTVQSILKDVDGNIQDCCYSELSSLEGWGIFCAGLENRDGIRAGELAVRQLRGDIKGSPYPSNIPRFLKNELMQLDQVIANKGEQSATSAMIVWLQKKKLYWGSVGDGKLFLIRNNQMYSINRVHNYQLLLDELQKAGKISEERYEKELVHKDRIVSYLGDKNILVLDVAEEPIITEPGDCILCCSRGIHRALTKEQIQSVIEDNLFDLDIAVRRLTKTAKNYDETITNTYAAMLIQV